MQYFAKKNFFGPNWGMMPYDIMGNDDQIINPLTIIKLIGSDEM